MIPSFLEIIRPWPLGMSVLKILTNQDVLCIFFIKIPQVLFPKGCGVNRSSANFNWSIYN
jgi:hypothetical protein